MYIFIYIMPMFTNITISLFVNIRRKSTLIVYLFIIFRIWWLKYLKLFHGSISALLMVRNMNMFYWIPKDICNKHFDIINFNLHAENWALFENELFMCLLLGVLLFEVNSKRFVGSTNDKVPSSEADTTWR